MSTDTDRRLCACRCGQTVTPVAERVQNTAKLAQARPLSMLLCRMPDVR